LLIAPKWGQNIDSSITVEVTKDSFRVGTKYQRGPMLVTVDSAGKRSNQNGKVNVDGFIEVKAPKTTWQQSKIALVSSYDITSISNFDVRRASLYVYFYLVIEIDLLGIYRSARNFPSNTSHPNPSPSTPR
jgi:hypothetical protein